MKKRSGKIRNKLITLFLLFPVWLNAQAPVRTTEGVQYNADKSVTFFYNNPNVRRVELQCDCALQREKKVVKFESLRSSRMRKEDDGRWSYTTPPLAPELYTYCFHVKGHAFPDPANPDSIRVGKGKRSVFVVTGSPQADLYAPDTLYGRVDTMAFTIPESGLVRKVLVYMPPGYTPDISWPVLYLLHGLNGNERAWDNRAHVVQVLDKLIRQNRAVPMVMVMPDANPNRLVGQDENVGLFKNLLLYSTWSKREFEQCFPFLDSCVSARYKISHNPEKRAAAGLSAGAKQSANLAKMYHSFHWIGLFSPVVTRKQIPDNEDTKIWIGVGKGDIFYSNAACFRKKLQRRQIPNIYHQTTGGHTWINWRQYFTEFVQMVFKHTDKQ